MNCTGHSKLGGLLSGPIAFICSIKYESQYDNVHLKCTSVFLPNVCHFVKFSMWYGRYFPGIFLGVGSVNGRNVTVKRLHSLAEPMPRMISILGIRCRGHNSVALQWSHMSLAVWNRRQRDYLVNNPEASNKENIKKSAYWALIQYKDVILPV